VLSVWVAFGWSHEQNEEKEEGVSFLARGWRRLSKESTVGVFISLEKSTRDYFHREKRDVCVCGGRKYFLLVFVLGWDFSLDECITYDGK